MGITTNHVASAGDGVWLNERLGVVIDHVTVIGSTVTPAPRKVDTSPVDHVAVTGACEMLRTVVGATTAQVAEIAAGVWLRLRLATTVAHAAETGDARTVKTVVAVGVDHAADRGLGECVICSVGAGTDHVNTTGSGKAPPPKMIDTAGTDHVADETTLTDKEIANEGAGTDHAVVTGDSA